MVATLNKNIATKKCILVFTATILTLEYVVVVDVKQSI